MNEPPLPLEESARLTSLVSLGILDTAPEARFDRITRMAQRVFAVETCLVGLVDTDRVWFKSRQGLEACEWPRRLEMKMCSISVAPMPSMIARPVACLKASKVAAGSVSPAETHLRRLARSAAPSRAIWASTR